MRIPRLSPSWNPPEWVILISLMTIDLSDSLALVLRIPQIGYKKKVGERSVHDLKVESFIKQGHFDSPCLIPPVFLKIPIDFGICATASFSRAWTSMACG